MPVDKVAANGDWLIVIQSYRLRHPKYDLRKFGFWATVCKTVRLCYRTVVPSVLPVCLSVCLSVCNVGVLWPNGWMDQDETWYGGRSRPRTHCVTRGLSSSSPKKACTAPNFRSISWPNGWINMPLGTEVGFGPGDIMLDKCKKTLKFNK